MQGELEILVDELRVEPLEIGVGRVACLHHADKSVAQLFPRHAERNDVRSIPVSCLVVVQPPLFFQPAIEGRGRYRVQLPMSAAEMRASARNFGITSKIEGSS